MEGLDILVSIDPGKSGAYAVFDESGDLVQTVKVRTPPKQRFFQGEQLDVLFNLLHAYSEEDYAKSDSVVMEGLLEHSVSYGRKGNKRVQSAKATNTTAHNHGMQHATCLLCGYDVDFVSPKEWKHAMGLTKDKELSVTLALELVDESFLIKPRMYKYNVDIAEAVLIGIYYGRKHLSWTV